MPNSDWLKRHSPWVAGVGGALAISAFLIYSFVEQAGYNQYSQSQAASYAGYAAEEQKQACVGITPAKLAQCRAKAQAEYNLKRNAGDRDYSDLIAQRKSALWAMIMGIAALIGMVLSAIGVILVKRTFDETQRTNRLAMKEHARSTRRAVASAKDTATALSVAKRNAKAAADQAKIAREAFITQNRPYVAFATNTLGVLENMHMPDGSIQSGAQFQVKWKNVGLTIAPKVHIGGMAHPWPSNQPDPTEMPVFSQPQDVPMAMAPGSVYNGFNFSILGPAWLAFSAGQLNFVVQGIVKYQGLGSEDFFETEYCGIVSANGTTTTNEGDVIPTTNFRIILPSRNRMT